MVQDILLALWFFLPAGIANATPAIVSKLPILKHWKTPIDLGMTHRGKRILGNNKTYRGFVLGVLAAAGTAWVQYEIMRGVEMTDFWRAAAHTSNYLLLGTLLGAGALIGDAVESYFKRQLGVPSGQSWFPFDQIDYIIGGLLLGSLISPLTPYGYLIVLLVWFVMHLLFSYIGFLLKLKNSPI